MTAIFKYFNIVISVILLGTNIGHAQNFSKNKKHDTTITSKLIDIKQKSQTIDFIKNVVIKSGPDIMTAQKVILFYKKNKNGKNEIENIQATDDVKIFASNFVATSEKGFYNPNKSIFILEDDVIVNNGNSIGVGDKFIYNLVTKQGEFVTTKKTQLKSKSDNRVSITIDNEKVNKQ